jgi:hypothetical protein
MEWEERMPRVPQMREGGCRRNAKIAGIGQMEGGLAMRRAPSIGEKGYRTKARMV